MPACAAERTSAYVRPGPASFSITVRSAAQASSQLPTRSTGTRLAASGGRLHSGWLVLAKRASRRFNTVRLHPPHVRSAVPALHASPTRPMPFPNRHDTEAVVCAICTVAKRCEQSRTMPLADCPATISGSTAREGPIKMSRSRVAARSTHASRSATINIRAASASCCSWSDRQHAATKSRFPQVIGLQMHKLLVVPPTIFLTLR